MCGVLGNRHQLCPGVPPGAASKSRALQTAEDAGGRSAQAGEVGSGGGSTDGQGVSLHPLRMQYLHLQLGAGKTQCRQK